MAKDAYWFKHDSTSGRGTRMMRLQKKFDHWGKGIYWDVIEVLREQDDYSFPTDDDSLSLLCELIRCSDYQRFIDWFNYCVEIGLFDTFEGVFYSPVLSSNMGGWEKQKLNGSKGGRPQKPNSKTQTENPTIKPNSETQPKTIREDKIREDKRGLAPQPHPFEGSPYFDKGVFVSKLESWPKDKIEYYYQALVEWSQQGNTYKDWVAAATSWARRDEARGILWSDKKKNKNIGNGMLDSYN
jgi:hypothetical protein